MITIKDISKKSGYSITTVSKALNDYSDISDKTKKKILDLCDEMGYVPNLSARGLISKKSWTIGVIFEEVSGVGLQHPLFSKILESFKNSVEQFHYDILFLSKNMGSHYGSYLEHSKRKQVDGIFILCGEYGSKELNDLYRSNIPTVVIDYHLADTCNVTSNNRQGVVKAVEYFYKLGHKKIGNIYGGQYLEIGSQRKEYFENALQKFDLKLYPQFSVSGEFFSKEDGYNAMMKILELEDQPTAIFCASDMLAIGAIQAIHEVGKNVPEDYSIIGFDGIDIGQMITPRLTTIRQDTIKMGKLAAHQMMNMINDTNDRKSTKNIIVDTQLIVGESTKVLR
jgi:LacI family transcriptional regulator